MAVIVGTAEAPGGPASANGPFSYSQGVIAGGLVFVSGQGPFDPVSGAIVGTTIQEQTRRCLQNIEAILEAAGSSVRKIVSVTFILRDPADFAGMNEVYAKYFTSDFPARSTVQVAALPKGANVEIEIVAHF